jgi:hypothetical protein
VAYKSVAPHQRPLSGKEDLRSIRYALAMAITAVTALTPSTAQRPQKRTYILITVPRLAKRPSSLLLNSNRPALVPYHGAVKRLCGAAQLGMRVE